MEMMDDQLAFSAQCLRARPPQTGKGNDETFAQTSQHPSTVVVKHIRNIAVTTCHVKERGDDDIASTSANDENSMRRNVHKEARKSRRAENIVYQRGGQFTTSRQRKPNTSKSLKKIFAVVVLLSIVSMTISGYVSYRMIIQPLDCNCTLTKASSETKVNEIKPERLKEILVTKINKLKKQFQELQNSTETQIDGRCKKTSNKCQTKLINNLEAQYLMSRDKTELLFNTTKGRMNKELEIAKIRINERMNFTAYMKDMLMQMNITFQTKLKRIQNKPKLQSPYCTLKTEIQSGNKSFVITQVPQKTENFVTVGVTCSTSVKNAPKYFYLRQATQDDDSYTCRCQNDDDTKRIDCIAYYWQCKIPHHN